MHSHFQPLLYTMKVGQSSSVDGSLSLPHADSWAGNNRDSDLARTVGLSKLLPHQVLQGDSMIQGNSEYFLFTLPSDIPHLVTLCPAGQTTKDCGRKLLCPVVPSGVLAKVSTQEGCKEGGDGKEEIERR